MDVVVAGCGPAGLHLAFILAQRGITVGLVGELAAGLVVGGGALEGGVGAERLCLGGKGVEGVEVSCV